MRESEVKAAMPEIINGTAAVSRQPKLYDSFIFGMAYSFYGPPNMSPDPFINAGRVSDLKSNFASILGQLQEVDHPS